MCSSHLEFAVIFCSFSSSQASNRHCRRTLILFCYYVNSCLYHCLSVYLCDKEEKKKKTTKKIAKQDLKFVILYDFTGIVSVRFDSIWFAPRHPFKRVFFSNCIFFRLLIYFQRNFIWLLLPRKTLIIFIIELLLTL